MAGRLGLRHASRNTNGFEIVEHPLLVSRLFLHVLVEKISDRALVVWNPARCRCTDRIEVPDDVIELNEKASIPID